MYSPRVLATFADVLSSARTSWSTDGCDEMMVPGSSAAR
jgi:hypothetical protein